MKRNTETNGCLGQRFIICVINTLDGPKDNCGGPEESVGPRGTERSLLNTVQRKELALYHVTDGHSTVNNCSQAGSWLSGGKGGSVVAWDLCAGSESGKTRL